jgi:hypothetical protein
LLAENVFNRQPYHRKGGRIIWAKCSLREYLNGEFLDELGDLKAAVIEKHHENVKNQWFKTPGGERKEDKVFLLSLKELVDYFGDSGRLDSRQGQEPYFSDQFNEARVAYNTSGDKYWWWLRSPGSISYRAAIVSDDGTVRMDGYNVSNDSCGVRPALWLNLESEIF